MKTNRLFACIYRGLAFLISLVGILLTLGVFKGNFSSVTLIYYTVQSNILVCLMFLYLFIKSLIDYKNLGIKGSSSYIVRFKGGIILAITVTFIIFWVLLAPQSFIMESTGTTNYLLSLDNNLVHTITPLLAIFDFILFDFGNSFRKYDPLLWLITPILYFIFAILRASRGNIGNTNSRYPYFFIDFDLNGNLVWVYVLVILIFFTCLGYLVKYYDSKRPTKALCDIK